jgi:hypothetical protein
MTSDVTSSSTSTSAEIHELADRYQSDTWTWNANSSGTSTQSNSSLHVPKWSSDLYHHHQQQQRATDFDEPAKSEYVRATDIAGILSPDVHIEQAAKFASEIE